MVRRRLSWEMLIVLCVAAALVAIGFYAGRAYQGKPAVILVPPSNWGPHDAHN